jgi:rubrerythrin
MTRKTSSKSSHFCSLLRAAIRDEAKAPKDYARLKNKAKCSCVKGKFQSIISDERKHKRTLVKLERKYCKGR